MENNIEPNGKDFVADPEQNSSRTETQFETIGNKTEPNGNKAELSGSKIQAEQE